MRSLWSHQVRALQLTAEEFKKGQSAICIVIPTGGGKSVTATEIVRRHLQKNPNGKVLFVAHREELISQLFDTITAAGLSCGAIQANPTREFNPYRPVQVASVQTLLARNLHPDATLIVLDEQHHYASDKWQAFVEHYRKRGIPIVGLTATPIRGDGRGFRDIMDAIVCPVTMKELIANGFLVPFELHQPKRTLRSDEIAADPVTAYQKLAAGRKTIVFAANVKAAGQYRDQFRAAGISCELVWGEMDPGERRKVLEAYKAGKIQVLTNVGVLTEGFDDRPTSCVIICRGIGSLSLYLQICGRALRCSPETGKRDAVIIDLHGSSHVHGAPDEDREWTLDGDGTERKKALEQPKERFCPVCKVLLLDDAAHCELCGIARPEAAAPHIVNVELVKYAAKRRESEEQKRAYFEKLKGIAMSKGWSKWQPVMKYRAVYNEDPPKAWR